MAENALEITHTGGQPSSLKRSFFRAVLGVLDAVEYAVSLPFRAVNAATGGALERLEDKTIASIDAWADRRTNKINEAWEAQNAHIFKPLELAPLSAAQQAAQDKYLAEVAANEAKHKEIMGGWDKVTDLMGVDMWEDEFKYACMKKVDKDPNNKNLSWEDFGAAVKAEYDLQMKNKAAGIAPDAAFSFALDAARFGIQSKRAYRKESAELKGEVSPAL